MNYFDFDIEINTFNGTGYPVAVRSMSGEARLLMHFPFEQQSLKDRLNDVQSAVLRSGISRRRIYSREEQVVQTFGKNLFDALITEEVRRLYYVSQQQAVERGCGLRIKLRILSPDLVVIPWEFLYDSSQGEYICRSRNTPVVRYLESPRPIKPMTVAPPLKILGMIASPGDQDVLNIDHEKERVQTAIQELEAQGRVELTWLPGQTWRDLQRAMRRDTWHIFHFIGHGGFDFDHDEGVIALTDEDDENQTFYLTAKDLASLLVDQHSLRLVLLNSCEGARSNDRDIFSSTAATLMQRDVPAVIAMQYEITDHAAIEFSRSFYQAVADGMPVDAAVAEARKAITIQANSSVARSTLEWGTPSLYMRSPNGLLFDIVKKTSTKQKRPSSRPTAITQDKLQTKGDSKENRAAQLNKVNPKPTSNTSKISTRKSATLKSEAIITSSPQVLKKPLPNTANISPIATIGRYSVDFIKRSYRKVMRICNNQLAASVLLLLVILDCIVLPLRTTSWFHLWQIPWISFAALATIFLIGLLTPNNVLAMSLIVTFTTFWFLVGYFSFTSIAILSGSVLSITISSLHLYIFRRNR